MNNGRLAFAGPRSESMQIASRVRRWATDERAGRAALGRDIVCADRRASGSGTHRPGTRFLDPRQQPPEPGNAPCA